jgi:2-methylcitrate dehydratase PrpD
MLTKTLSTFIVETGFDDIPQIAVERAKHHILDGIGVMLAGSTHPISRRVMNHVRSLGGAPQASVLGGGFKTSAPQAAFINATMGHVLDFDDDSDTMISHPTVTILPALMALGENRSSGRQLLAAYILGVETSARIAALPGFLPGHYEKGWHTTSTLGVLNAVAGSAKILDLDACQVRSGGRQRQDPGSRCVSGQIGIRYCRFRSRRFEIQFRHHDEVPACRQCVGKGG